MQDLHCSWKEISLPVKGMFLSRARQPHSKIRLCWSLQAFGCLCRTVKQFTNKQTGCVLLSNTGLIFRFKTTERFILITISMAVFDLLKFYIQQKTCLGRETIRMHHRFSKDVSENSSSSQTKNYFYTAR